MTVYIYKVIWDNGRDACGTFPYEFDTWEEADAYGREWVSGWGSLGDDEEGYSYDVIEVEGEPEYTDEEKEEACQGETMRKAGLNRGQP